MPIKFTNNAFGTLLASIRPHTTDILIHRDAGVSFPRALRETSEYFYATLFDVDNNLEIVKVVGKNGLTFTVERAQEGTTARAYAVGDRIEHRITAQGLEDALADILDDAADAADTIAANTVGAVIPDQTGNVDKFLTTDGANTSWADIAGSGTGSGTGSGLQMESLVIDNISTTVRGQVVSGTDGILTITPTVDSKLYVGWALQARLNGYNAGDSIYIRIRLRDSSGTVIRTIGIQQSHGRSPFYVGSFLADSGSNLTANTEYQVCMYHTSTVTSTTANASIITGGDQQDFNLTAILQGV